MPSHKKIILLITLLLNVFFTLLPAEEATDYASVSLYELREKSHVHESNRSQTMFKDINITIHLLKSHNSTLTIDNIYKHHTQFKAIPKSEKFQDDNVTYWIKVDLGKHFPNGKYIVNYGDAKIVADTMHTSQQVEHFHINGLNYMKFIYNHTSDSSVYYFKLQAKHFRMPFRYISISLTKDFYTSIFDNFKIQLLLGLILGLIIMAAIYNASMYYYNRDISFLYYALMQLFMGLILFDYTGTYMFDESSYFARNITYGSLISLGAALFGTLFTMYFLELKVHLPKLHKFLNITLFFIGLDAIVTLFDKSYIFEYYLFPFFMLVFLYAGFRRIQQGYKPAKFYLAGWIILTIAVFLNIFRIGYDYTRIDPLYIGAMIEAILLSLALSYKMRLIAQEQEEQKELLVHQSKLASMGEMIGNIAHQWRQPLSHLSYTFMNIKEAQKHGELDEGYLTKKVDEATVQLEFMSQTIDDFKDFYLPTKEKEHFMLSHATKETLEIMEHTFKSSDIEIIFNIEKDFEIANYKNEYKQVLLNLLSNAKDALIERVTLSPKIIVTISHHTVTVSDNAGGIKKEILDRIFEPYFSTKEGNSGIGLYMSKMIVEKNMEGKLKLINIPEGISCSISF